MINRKNKRTARIGVFAVAHATYWGQFEGLLDNIMGYHNDFCKMTEKNDVEVIDFGMIDSSEKAYEAYGYICNFFCFCTNCQRSE